MQPSSQIGKKALRIKGQYTPQQQAKHPFDQSKIAGQAGIQSIKFGFKPIKPGIEIVNHSIELGFKMTHSNPHTHCQWLGNHFTAVVF